MAATDRPAPRAIPRYAPTPLGEERLKQDIHAYLLRVHYSTVRWLGGVFGVPPHRLGRIMRLDPRFRRVPPKQWYAAESAAARGVPDADAHAQPRPAPRAPARRPTP